MARKEWITKDKILETAFDLARREGIESVTARKLAVQIGCSTQPIFRVYANMGELYAQIYQKAAEAFHEHCENFKSEADVPFINLGLAYIDYAKAEKKLFSLLFQSDYRDGRSLEEILNGKSNAVGAELDKLEADGRKNPKGLFLKMFMAIHGCACLTLSGDCDLTQREIIQFLEGIYKNC